MKYLPLGLDLRDRICIVVGGGQVGGRKAIQLARAGASVRVIAPAVSEEVGRLAEAGEMAWMRREYREGDMDGAFLVVSATDDPNTNARIVEEATGTGLLICDASSASRSQVIFGALHEGQGITLAIFTDGRDPSLARRTRDRIAALKEEWGGR